MERSMREGKSDPHAELATGYDLERQLETAERRYAEARAASDKARAELRALSTQEPSNVSAIGAARSRFEVIAARCTRLRDLIETLEERLEG